MYLEMFSNKGYWCVSSLNNRHVLVRVNVILNFYSFVIYLCFCDSNISRASFGQIKVAVVVH